MQTARRPAGGEVVTPLTPQGEGEAFATFRDPAGNVVGTGQQPYFWVR